LFNVYRGKRLRLVQVAFKPCTPLAVGNEGETFLLEEAISKMQVRADVSPPVLPFLQWHIYWVELSSYHMDIVAVRTGYYPVVLALTATSAPP